ncbi:E3 ubiquitin/ISG15 ligase TRIM25-like [Hyla sarda]|uniref:E3 ubiquitin/ISG15 ligase TRIM25-like n=1 Tax=Hyla sarda TaxID=327740 RepID=UPI0024C25A7C|nr:E3 ubiquitin/ISG15 ligase TRIM25-like [Hyla sarda]
MSCRVQRVTRHTQQLLIPRFIPFPRTMDSADLKDELTCSICLNIFRDPVTLRCGHNFCLDCIDRLLGEQDSTGVYKCPACNKIFSERPSPQRNVTLSSIAQRFLSTKPEEEEAMVILCSYCIHSSVPAVKSCLLCEASLCEDHLRVHSKSPEHVLSDPTAAPEITKCSIHKEILKYYCSEDEECICVSCSLVGKHKGHSVDLLPDAAHTMKEQLNDIQENLTKMRDEAENKLQFLQDRKTKLSEKAAEIKRRQTDIIRNIRSQLDLLEIQVVSEISQQEEKASLSLSDLIQQLGKDRDDLSTIIGNIKEIDDMTDPLTILQEGASYFQQVDTNNEKTEEPNIQTVGNLDEGLISEMIHTKIYDIVMGINDDLHCHEATGLSLDSNTASNNVSLSEDFKSASRTDDGQNVYENPGRFTTHAQVLSTKSFSSGRHYWEVETNPTNYWMMGMCYPSIERNGPKSWVGASHKSWGLRREYNRYSMSHGGKVISLPTYSSGHRVRVYLDYEAGRLSFYELCHPLKHLHTFKTTFTEPLHVVFCVWNQSWLRFRS